MIPIVKPFLPPNDELMPELEEIIYSGYIAEGEKVYDFERRFSRFIGNKYCLSVNSGTAALHIALILAGVGPGDEVISTPLTAEPTNISIKMAGAKVVWADVDPNNGLIDAKSVRSRITSKTKAIMLVHYAGMVCDLNEFNQISKEFNIPLIEDAAHALGSKFNNKFIGDSPNHTIFSFQAIKHMTTVDGGMLAVNSQEVFDKGRLKRWFGIDKTKPRLENDIVDTGFKYHMNNVNATIGIVQLRHIAEVIKKHINNGMYFDKNLNGLSGLSVPTYYKNTEPSYWIYTLKVERRSDFIRLLNQNGIAASELHLRNDKHTLFSESKRELPQLDDFYGKLVHIPCGWWVNSEDRQKIVEVINKGW
ncbi:DegT/DnrJ/EryC1/StrS family aminotransferase [Paenibacillus sp. 598K]|uniref:DegT/DnrJ/EryC1/StrS family aminotransferase n=1 Tax=Paenibacillus sp. 598K TaxID=1117987 RepID=UPI000FFA2738|nr:DegT/DnrJ/EryC1/StrS family aminotransferase [Paenibacillus sp. 598K]GBF73567.1 DegT/DnrJ/EryC1/StrS family aminotransferase [Paenibacillus sp. 598K]